MQLLRCTKKLQKEMGLRRADLSQSEPSISVLGPWHANLIHINGRKCVLFTNDRTLFHFLVPDVSRAQIRILDRLFRGFLDGVLAEEGFSEGARKKILDEYREIEYANTNSKKVLGSMNDLAFHYKIHLLSVGGIHSGNLPQIIKNLNRMPMGMIGYRFSSEALKELYRLAP